jgi:CheY-like chemotaxis protein
MHILIIEDDPLLALDLQMFVEDLGAVSSLVASSEDEAIDRAKRFPPDVILADLRLREGFGPSAIQAIRDVLGDVPVIYITGNAAEARAIDASAPVLEKPFNWDELTHVLTSVKIRRPRAAE